MRRLAPLAIAALALMGCGRGGEAAATGAQEGGWRGTVVDPPQSKPSFVLTDTTGSPYDFRARTDGNLTLLFFGYTHCPDVCPLHLTNLAAVLAALPGDVRVNTTVVFATTDPARDTPEVLRRYLAQFNAGFVGLTGSAEEVRQAQLAAGVAVAGAEPADADGNYVVGHAAQVIAYTRDGLARVVYPFGTRQADWADDLPRLLQEPAWNP